MSALERYIENDLKQKELEKIFLDTIEKQLELLFQILLDSDIDISKDQNWFNFLCYKHYDTIKFSVKDDQVIAEFWINARGGFQAELNATLAVSKNVMDGDWEAYKKQMRFVILTRKELLKRQKS